MLTFKAKLLTKLISSNFIWSILKRPIYWSDALKHYRAIFDWENDISPIIRIAKEIFSDLVVRNGPFKGMKYPDFLATGSSIFPKLLGSYERELHPLISGLFSKDYSEIIDIGCAEGYYAVGFALRMPNAIVYAYDTDAVARKACISMAELNNVADSINVQEKCSPETLANFKFSKRGLIISDCEGYEKYLFTDLNISNLTNCDILIEVHDFVDKLTSQHLRKIFTETHNLVIIDSLSDHLKISRYEYSELSNLGYKERLNILGEGRPTTMEWFYFTPKNEMDGIIL